MIAPPSSRMTDEATTSSTVNLTDPGCDVDHSTNEDHPVNFAVIPSNAVDIYVRRRGVAPLPEGHLTVLRGIFLVVNGALGAGLLNFPQAYYIAGGVVPAFIVQTLMVVLVMASFFVIATCADASQSGNYFEMVRVFIGHRMQVVVELVTVIYMFGSCVTYMIIIGDQVEKVAELASGGGGYWFTDRRFLIGIICTVFLLPLCLPRQLRIISYTSVLGTLASLYITGTVMVKKLIKEYPPPPVDPPRSTSDIVIGCLQVMPVMCFGFQVHIFAVSVYSEMRNRTKPSFLAVTLAGCTTCCVIYTLTGAFGYLTFGSGVDADILLNYGSKDAAASVARIMIVMVILSTYAMVVFCTRVAADNLLVRLMRISPEKKMSGERLRHIIFTLVWFLLSMLLALFLPSINTAIGYVGGLAAFLIFVFPGLCYLKLRTLFGYQHFQNVAIIITGLLFIVTGVFIFGEATAGAVMQSAKSG